VRLESARSSLATGGSALRPVRGASRARCCCNEKAWSRNRAWHTAARRRKTGGDPSRFSVECPAPPPTKRWQARRLNVSRRSWRSPLLQQRCESQDASPRVAGRRLEGEVGGANGVPIMARWLRQRVSPTTATRLQRCPAITLQLHRGFSPSQCFGSGSGLAGFSDTSTTSPGRPPWAIRSLAERVPVAEIVGIGTPLPGLPVVPRESRHWIAYFSVSAVLAFGVSMTNAGSWLASGLWTEGGGACRRSQPSRRMTDDEFH
jgi:hypothetical protein